MKRMLVLLLLLGCSRATTPPVVVVAQSDLGGRSIGTLAVLPAEAAPQAETLSSKALEGVTEILVWTVSRAGGWVVVPPEHVTSRVGEARSEESLAARAGRGAAAVGADAALTAEIQRYRERVGSDYGVRDPASVTLRLILVLAGGTEAVWIADYSFTQRPLSENLWNFWGVLRGGPKWLTAAEISQIGIDEAVSRLRAADGR